jgi:adenosylcobyric acid synthase
VSLSEPLGRPDAIIIPGTKNTVSDLREMQEKGMADQIRSCVNTPVLGICGGYQMLGKEIIDCGVEDTVGTIPGLGLLDAVTRFDLYEKKTVQVKKVVTGGGPILEPISGQPVTGYEIHMGVTSPKGAKAFGDDGAVSENGLVIGTYLHGLFENENFCNAFLDFLFRRKGLGDGMGLPSETEAKSGASKDDGFEQLARATVANLDMARIWMMLDLGQSDDKSDAP